MKQTTLTQRLAAALVALCMVLSVCAPALAAEPDGDWTSENDKNSKTFTFKMPEGDVSLRAEYRETYRIFETAGKAEFFAEGAEEQKIHEALPGTRIIRRCRAQGSSQKFLTASSTTTASLICGGFSARKNSWNRIKTGRASRVSASPCPKVM